MNIVIIGHVCIDDNKTEKSSFTGAGSPAMFMRSIFSQIPDIDLSIIAPYGQDFKQYSKDVTLLPSKPLGRKTLVYQNISKNGKRTQFAFNRMSAKPAPLNNEMKKVLQKADALMLAVLLPNYSKTYVKKLLSFLKPNCLKVLSPQGYFRAFTEDNQVIPRTFKEQKEILPLFDVVILSEEDYPNIKKISLQWLKNIQINMIITKSEQGADLVNSEGIINIPTKEIKDVVDSTGAGDVFTAAFTYKYLKTKNSKKAILFAHKIAGLSVRYSPNEIDIRK